MSEIPYLSHLCRYEVPVVSFITVRGTFIQTIPYVIRRYFKHLVKSNTVKKIGLWSRGRLKVTAPAPFKYHGSET